MGVLATLQARPGVRVVSWETLQIAAATDKLYLKLVSQGGSRDKYWDDELREYERYAEKLSVVQDVVLYDGRVIVPRVLRGEVLRVLHRAHQGATSMGL